MTSIAVTCLLAVSAAQADGSRVSERVNREMGPERDGPQAVRQDKSSRGSKLPPSSVPRSETCRSARRGLRWYQRHEREWRNKMGAGKVQRVATAVADSRSVAQTCPRIRYLAKRWREKARAARIRYASWHDYHYAWWKWLPAKWQRIGACETGYGKRPGDWRWNSGTYQGAFGFYHGSWDAFVPHADPRARPYPSEAYLATPRQQYEVALAIWRRYGFSGWGCRNA